MTHVNETVVRYIAAWNERDPKRRRELVGETWTDDGSYVDAHRNGSGPGAIDAMPKLERSMAFARLEGDIGAGTNDTAAIPT